MSVTLFVQFFFHKGGDGGYHPEDGEKAKLFYNNVLDADETFDPPIVDIELSGAQVLIKYNEKMSFETKRKIRSVYTTQLKKYLPDNTEPSDVKIC